MFQLPTAKLLLSLLMILIGQSLLGKEEIIITDEFSTKNITPHVLIFEDKGSELDVLNYQTYDKQFKSYKKKILSRVRKPGGKVWLKWKIRNTSSTSKSLRILCRSDALERSLFQIHKDSIINQHHSGRNYAPNDKAINSNKTILPITIPALETHIVFIMADSDDLFSETYFLMTLDAFDRYNIINNLIQGIIVGGLFFFSLLSIVLFLLLKSATNFYYMLYASLNSVTLYVATNLFEYGFFPDVAPGHFLQFFLILLMSIFYLRFIFSYYESRNQLNFPRFIFWSYAIVVLFFLLGIVLAQNGLEGFESPFLQRLPMMAVAIMCVGSLVLIIYKTIQLPDWRNILFFLAFFGLTVAGIITIFLRNGLIDLGELWVHLYPIVILLEFFFLSIVLAFEIYKIFITKKTLELETIAQQRELEQAAVIKKAHDEKDILLREIHHRVKNNLQVISALLSLQSHYVKDLNAKEALRKGQNRVESMAIIHRDLYQHENLTGVNTSEYIEQLVQNLLNSYSVNLTKINLHLDIEDISLDVDTMIPLGLMINELVSNALKHALDKHQNGVLQVSLLERDEQLVLTVADNGKGISTNDYPNAKSFGQSLVKSLSKQLDAKVNIGKSNEYKGLETKIYIRKYKKNT